MVGRKTDHHGCLVADQSYSYFKQQCVQDNKAQLIRTKNNWKVIVQNPKMPE